MMPPYRNCTAVRTILLVVPLTIAATSVTFTQIRTNGEIAGTIATREGDVLPGVRVVVKGRDDARREAVTDAHGRFQVSGLTLGSYSVHAELAGFIPASGSITLSDSTSRAHLAWSLDLGCLSDDIVIPMGPREAAPIADAIVHVRLTSVDGLVVYSTRPDCDGVVVRAYTAKVLSRMKGKAGGDQGALRMFLQGTGTLLKPGGEYIAILWSGGLTDDGLILPIESGRVVAPAPEPLGGMTVEAALKTLTQWARERQR